MAEADPDQTVFEEDARDNMGTKAKNSALADLLTVTYASTKIVKIERLEIGVKGWRITYRDS
jgi:hypothetical protein